MVVTPIIKKSIKKIVKMNVEALRDVSGGGGCGGVMVEEME